MLDGQLENLLLLGFWVTFSLLQADLSDLIYHLLDLYHFYFIFLMRLNCYLLNQYDKLERDYHDSMILAKYEIYNYLFYYCMYSR